MKTRKTWDNIIEEVNCKWFAQEEILESKVNECGLDKYDRKDCYKIGYNYGISLTSTVDAEMVKGKIYNFIDYMKENGFEFIGRDDLKLYFEKEIANEVAQ